MKNKFLSFVLSILLILPSAMGLVACGQTPPGDTIDDIDKLSDSEWRALLDVTDFTLMQGMVISEGIDAKGFMMTVYGDDYMVYNHIVDRDPRYDENDDSQNCSNYYRKNINGSETTYQRVVANVDEDTLDVTYEKNSINKAKYDSNLTDVVNLINYVRDNQSKFSEGKYKCEIEKLPGYKLDIEGSEVEGTISNILSLMGLNNRLVDYIFVHKHSNKLAVVYDAREIFTLTFNYDRVSLYDYHLVMESMKNNVKMTSGDPSDNDYSIFTVTDVGFHTQYPNHSEDSSVEPKDLYGYVQEDDTYLVFYKQNSEWTTALQSNYTSTINNMFKVNTGNIENRDQYFYWGEGKIYTKESYTYTTGGVTYTYSDVVINIDGNNNITSMTWTMTSPNAVEHKVITPNTQPILFPTIEE